MAEWMQLRASWPINDASPLFCTQSGTRLSDRQVRAMFSRKSKQAKIEKHVHPHGMRRTMASEMAAEGIPLIDISGALGPIGAIFGEILKIIFDAHPGFNHRTVDPVVAGSSPVDLAENSLVHKNCGQGFLL